jgi:non-heme chloroperoxidase
MSATRPAAAKWCTTWRRVAKAAIISAVPPLMLKTAANPTGQPKEVFDGLQAQLAANRSQFYYDVAAGPFYGYNRPGAKPSQGTIWNWWRQGMMGGTKAHYDGIVAFSQTDFTEDLKKIAVPVLVMHSEDDQIVPYRMVTTPSIEVSRRQFIKGRGNGKSYCSSASPRYQRSSGRGRKYRRPYRPRRKAARRC